MNLDDRDRKLLSILQKDSRTKYAELAEKLHLSAPAVYGRVKKLKCAGIIRRYTVDLDASKLGLGLCAYVNVFLAGKTCLEVAPLLEPFQEIEECHSVAGEHCLILKVRIGSPKALGGLLTTLRKLPGIDRTTTSLVLGTYWSRARVC